MEKTTTRQLLNIDIFNQTKTTKTVKNIVSFYLYFFC